MADIIPFTKTIKGQYPTIKDCMLDVMERFPDATTGIVIVFDAQDEDMFSFFCASDQQLALASVRLAHVVNQEPDT